MAEEVVEVEETEEPETELPLVVVDNHVAVSYPPSPCSTCG